MCANKWHDNGFLHSLVANKLLSTLSLCGLELRNVGNTHLADRLSQDGGAIESALDHTYTSADLKDRSQLMKLETSSTDHVPIITKMYYRNEKRFDLTPRSQKGA